jgi:hypothetical protein
VVGEVEVVARERERCIFEGENEFGELKEVWWSGRRRI